MSMLQDRFDLKKIANTPWVENLTKQFNGYESRVKRLVKDIDLKGREARTKGKKQLNRFTHQLQKTRNEVEKKVTVLINKESKKLNGKVTELFKYLKTMANNEKQVKVKKTTAKKRNTVSAKKKAAPKKNRSRIEVASRQMEAEVSPSSLPN